MWLAFLPVAGLITCVLVHIGLSRTARLSRPRAGLAGFLAGLGAVVLPAVLLGQLPVTELALLLVAWVLTYVCLAYCYIFGFFNVGESARRIRLLIELRAAGPRGLTLEEILAAYNAEMVTEARLQRLLAGRQVVQRGERYVIGRPDLLVVARVLNGWKQVAFGSHANGALSRPASECHR